MSIVSCIKKRFAYAVIKKCSESNCQLKLNGLSNYIVLKGEKICNDRKICDCIIFKENHHIIIAVIELKSKNIRASEIREKLTNGREKGLMVLEKCNDNDTIDFFHIVLYKNIRVPEYRVIAAEKIMINGKRHPVILKKCGESFSKLISDRSSP